MAAPKYRQGDLVFLTIPVPLPDGTELEHPVLIISNETPNSIENSYIAVMMSATAHTDRFSFLCEDSMFESPLAKSGCNFRIHIIINIREVQISRFVNRIKPVYLKALLKQINERIFSV